MSARPMLKLPESLFREHEHYQALNLLLKVSLVMAKGSGKLNNNEAKVPVSLFILERNPAGISDLCQWHMFFPSMGGRADFSNSSCTRGSQ